MPGTHKPVWKLILWLVVFTLEGVGISAGLLYLAFYLSPDHFSRGFLLYVGLPFNLVLMAAIAWVNIRAHFHPEEEQEESDES